LSVSSSNSRENEEGKTTDPAGNELVAIKLDESEVEKQGEHFVLKSNPEIRVDAKSFKMSKSRGNVVNPDRIVKEYGADSLRLYEMFMGPLEATKPWNMSGVGGVRNFLDRVWRMIVDAKSDDVVLSKSVVDGKCDGDQNRMLHRTIKAVTEDTEGLSFNTAIARMMEFVNFYTRQEQRPREAMASFVLLLSPYAPHLAEELWKVLGHSESLAYEPWPQWDESALIESMVELAVQVNGKVRAKITVAADLDQDSILKVALANERVQAEIEGKQVVKTIVVPGRMVNIAVK
jgi:leucyl-tRNA synthetase